MFFLLGIYNYSHAAIFKLELGRPIRKIELKY